MTNEPRRPNSADSLYGPQWLLNPADRFPVAMASDAGGPTDPWVLGTGSPGLMSAVAPSDPLWRRLVNDRRAYTAPE